MATDASAVLRGYDDARGEATTPAEAQRAKRGRLDAFARAYARRMESDDDGDGDDDDGDDDDEKENDADDATTTRDDDDGRESEDEEARDWRAMRAGGDVAATRVGRRDDDRGRRARRAGR